MGQIWQILAVSIPAAVVILGWVISVERRITTLQAMATDIHAIRDTLETFVKSDGHAV